VNITGPGALGVATGKGIGGMGDREGDRGEKESPRPFDVAYRRLHVLGKTGRGNKPAELIRSEKNEGLVPRAPVSIYGESRRRTHGPR